MRPKPQLTFLKPSVRIDHDYNMHFFGGLPIVLSTIKNKKSGDHE